MIRYIHKHILVVALFTLKLKIYLHSTPTGDIMSRSQSVASHCSSLDAFSTATGSMHSSGTSGQGCLLTGNNLPVENSTFSLLPMTPSSSSNDLVNKEDCCTNPASPNDLHFLTDTRSDFITGSDIPATQTPRQSFPTITSISRCNREPSSPSPVMSDNASQSTMPKTTAGTPPPIPSRNTGKYRLSSIPMIP